MLSYFPFLKLLCKVVLLYLWGSTLNWKFICLHYIRTFLRNIQAWFASGEKHVAPFQGSTHQFVYLLTTFSSLQFISRRILGLSQLWGLIYNMQ